MTPIRGAPLRVEWRSHALVGEKDFAVLLRLEGGEFEGEGGWEMRA